MYTDPNITFENIKVKILKITNYKKIIINMYYNGLNTPIKDLFSMNVSILSTQS